VASSHDCLRPGDAHPRVSAPSSSGPVVMPLVVTRMHNPMVVASERQCGGSPSRSLTASDPAMAGPGEFRVPHLFARVCYFGIRFIS
jgi:hypothetical protein